MKNLFFLILAIGCTALYSCKEGSTTGTDQVERKTSAAGYEYVHHVQNKGPKVKEGDKVFFHLVVHQNDTTKLQSSYDQGSPFPQIIPPAASVPKPTPPTYEALMMMSEGDSLSIWQKLDSVPSLPPNFSATDVIRFDLKLVDIKTKEEVDAGIAAGKLKEESINKATLAQIDAYKAGKLDGQIKTTASGLKYLIQKEGTGAQAAAGKTVSVNYSGFLLDGVNFDNSFKRGEPIEFPLGMGRVIPGWDEGIALLKAGGEGLLFIPYQLGYGEAGSPPNIPGKAELIFFVELVDVK